MLMSEEKKVNNLKQQVWTDVIEKFKNNPIEANQILSDLKTIYEILCFVKKNQKNAFDRIYYFRVNNIKSKLKTDYVKRFVNGLSETEVRYLKKFLRDILLSVVSFNVKFNLKFKLEESHKQILTKILIKRYKLSPLPEKIYIIKIENSEGKLIDQYIIDFKTANEFEIDIQTFNEEIIHRKIFDIIAYNELIDNGTRSNWSNYVHIL